MQRYIRLMGGFAAALPGGAIGLPAPTVPGWPAGRVARQERHEIVDRRPVPRQARHRRADAEGLIAGSGG